MLTGTVRTYFASLEALTLNVICCSVAELGATSSEVMAGGVVRKRCGAVSRRMSAKSGQNSESRRDCLKVGKRDYLGSCRQFKGYRWWRCARGREDNCEVCHNSLKGRSEKSLDVSGTHAHLRQNSWRAGIRIPLPCRNIAKILSLFLSGTASDPMDPAWIDSMTGAASPRTPDDIWHFPRLFFPHHCWKLIPEGSCIS